MTINRCARKSLFPMMIGLASSLVMAMACMAQAKQAVVELNDGRQITGELIVDNNQHVILEIAGIRTTFLRESVVKVTPVKSIEEQYRERRATIASDDLEKRYELTRWLFENKAYNLAKTELADLIERFPRDNRLVPLQRVIEARLKLLEEPPASSASQQPAKADSSAKPSDATTAAAGDGKPASFERQEVAPRLNDEQINLIRVYEVNPSARPRVMVPNDVMEDVYKNYTGQEGVPVGAVAQRRALGAQGWEKLQLLFSLRARELYSRVTVYEDPVIIQNFRSNIHSRYVLSYCAATSCHGGADAGKLLLFRFQPGSNQTVYTNYYILHKYSDAKGYMIDREKPDLSYLVQYALPRDVATTPHPQVEGWQPLARNLEDDHARRVIAWIRSLGSAVVQYPISYAIPRVDESGKVVTTSAPPPVQSPKPSES